MAVVVAQHNLAIGECPGPYCNELCYKLPYSCKYRQSSSIILHTDGILDSMLKLSANKNWKMDFY